MDMPVVSVIMAAYNGVRWLPATLASLQAQTRPDFEVLVVDDGSTDGTRDLVRAWPDPRVRLIALAANGGCVHARNRAVADARGRYLAALDQDDLCKPDRFERQVAYLDRHPGTVLVGTQVTLLEGERERASTYPAVTSPALIDWLLGIENPIAWSSVMVRANAARRLQPFTRPELHHAEDFDLYQRLRAVGRIARIDRPLVVYRIHPEGMSKQGEARMLAAAAQVLAERHRPLLGDRAEETAGLLVRHVMEGDPAPDAATLMRLGSLLAELQAAYLAANDLSPADRRLIRWETDARWAAIGRASLRRGAIGIGDVIATPAGLPIAALDTLLTSGAIGGVRRARQTLAAKIIRPLPSRANT